MEDTAFALPITQKQIAYARALALKNRTLLAWETQQDRRALSAWIDAQARLKPVSDLDRLPSSSRWPSPSASPASSAAPSRKNVSETKA